VTQPPESDPGTPPPEAQPPQLPSDVPTEQAPQWPGPEAMQPTTQFSQPVPPEPGPQPYGPPQYGQQPTYPQAPGYDQPMYPPPPGYGQPPTYGQPPVYGQPPGYRPPPGGYPPYGGGYGQPPPKRGNGGKIVGIIVAALAVIALGLGAFLAFGGNNKNDSGQTTNRSSQTASSPSVAPSSEPSSDTSSPTTDTTTGTDKASQDQKDAAKVIEDFFHRAGARGTAFCDDADAADVQKLWSIPCYRIDPYTSAQRTQMLAISIEARDIILHGNVGAATMYKPVNLVKFWGPIQVRKNCKTLWNGAQWCAWKVRL
jgi:hypothetical protein